MKPRLVIQFVLTASALLAQPYTISTIAGGGPPPSGVPALGAAVSISGGMAANDAGDVYFTSGNSVLKVDGKGVLTRIAGTGRYGRSGDGGPASSAALAWPAGLAADTSGNVYITENAGHRIRKVSRDGTITTIAGTGNSGDSGDGGPAIHAQLYYPIGIAVDASGNLYIADTGNNRIRKVSAEGIITTVAAGFHHPEGVAVDASGDVYITDYLVGEAPCEDCDEPYIGRVVRVTPTGIVETVAGGGKDEDDNGPAASALLETPRGIAVDKAGTLYVSDWVNNRVRKISRSGVITTAAGDKDFSNRYLCFYPSEVYGRPAPLRCPVGVVLDSSGNLYVADTGNHRIRKISPQGDIVNIAGSGVPGTYWGDGGRAQDAALSYPLGVAVDASANLYIADTGNSRVRKVSPDGVITTFAGTGTSGYSGDGGPATSAQLRGPAGLAFDASGNLYIADSADHRIRMVSPAGTITTVAGNGVTGHGFGPWGDGGPATAASLAGPRGVTVDGNGNLYIADTFHLSLRKVSTSGIITTVAGRMQSGQSACQSVGTGTDFMFPTGLAMDGAGALHIADSCGIRKLLPNGSVSVVARNGYGGYSGDGGPAASAQLDGSFAVTVDAAGNIFILGKHLRKVTADGIISTIAGNGTEGYSGDGGPALSGSFSNPLGIAVNAPGDVYIADAYNHVIRVLRSAAQ